MTALYKNSFPAIVAKAASYQIKPEDHGTLFTTRGHASGTITLTLPAAADLHTGWGCEFFTIGAGCLSIAAAAGLIVTQNDAAANSVEIGTASEIIGVGVEIVFDGTSFLLMQMAAEAYTLIVTT